MTDNPPAIRLSIVLPTADDPVRVRSTVNGYTAALEEEFGEAYEILLVADQAGIGPYAAIAESHPAVRVVQAPGDGWGLRVGVGLREARGDVLCYTNYERTPQATLVYMLRFALSHPEVVLRANRRTRDTYIQRFGSLLFNIACRMLLGLYTWDVNGTPKIFPRSFGRLLEIERVDDLFDVVFALVCERERYPVVEIPVQAAPLPGLPLRPDYRAALRIYMGVLRIHRQTRSAAR